MQRPLELGADFVMHSSTKYFGGHSDVMGGAIVARVRSPSSARIRSYQAIAGGVPSPFDCWLIRRGIATLPLRVKYQCANALEIARFLRQHPRVERVYYPGLEDDPGHAVAARQMRGFGAIVSVGIKGAAAEALEVAARTQLFTRATSLGGVESLIEHRASVEGPDTPTPQNLLRLSIGIEDAQDLIADLDWLCVRPTLRRCFIGRLCARQARMSPRDGGRVNPFARAPRGRGRTPARAAIDHHILRLVDRKLGQSRFDLIVRDIESAGYVACGEFFRRANVENDELGILPGEAPEERILIDPSDFTRDQRRGEEHNGHNHQYPAHEEYS
jgi:hypothetical protein